MQTENTNIDISKLDKAHVLVALFNASKQQGMGFLNRDGARPLTKEEAAEAIKEQPYFDYFRGRVMKVDLKGDNGQGAAARAIDKIR